MPRDDAYILSDLPPGFRVELRCSKCDRAGRYRVETLIERFGVDHPIPSLLSDISYDCPRRITGFASDRCGIFFENKWPWA